MSGEGPLQFDTESTPRRGEWFQCNDSSLADVGMGADKKAAKSAICVTNRPKRGRTRIPTQMYIYDIYR